MSHFTSTFSLIRRISICIVFLIQASCAHNHKVMLGDTPVIVQYTPGHGKTFVHLHQNEKTALVAAKAVIHREGGSLLTLIHPGGRNIAFNLNNKRYEFDPNRIFSERGIKKTLLENSHHYSPEAHQEVKKLALEIQHLLPKGKIVAVHNNNGYSLKDYLPGHELAHDISALHMNPDRYYRNFYLLTQSSDYQRLKLEGFNGVLQKPSATDDGSLSILLAQSEYINVEAGYDQLVEQIKMLERA
jgi:hypothetical protein